MYAGLVCGLLCPLLFPALPEPAWWALVVVLAVVAAAHRRAALALCLAGAAWTGMNLDEARSNRDAFATPREMTLSGIISSAPVSRGDHLEFEFRPSSGFPGAKLRNPSIRVRWYRNFPAVQAGQRWRLALSLKPARSRLNFVGTDPERAMFARDVVALGTVRDAWQEASDSPAGPRQEVVSRLGEALDGHPSGGVALALAVAERGALDSEDWERYRLTGTSHLFAISGLHVGLAAMLGLLAGRLLLFCAPVRLALRCGLYLPWLLAVGCASWYATMAGLQTSTRRALAMLLVIAAIRLLKRRLGLGQGLVLALAAVLVLNPLAPLAAGFWLSFLAVTALLLMFAPRTGPQHRATTVFTCQAGLTLLLAPATLYWFQQLPLAGVLVNLLAIPWVSVAVAPPAILAALLGALDASWARFPLFMAAEGARVLESGLLFVERGAAAIALQGGGATVPVTIVASLGAAILLLPRGVPQRLGGVLLLLPLLLPAWPRRDELQVEVLDVGQGLAVLVAERGHTLIYDSGPGDGRQWSLVPGVVAPALAAGGRYAPDRVIISHGDLDHAGGLHTLQARYPDAAYMVNGRSRPRTAQACRSPLAWRADVATYRILHPSPGLPYIGNDSSCVLGIESAGGRVLLTGDIGTAIEQRLLSRNPGRYELLFAPHHGSRSSSGAEFIKSVSPEVAVASAGFANRFGLPHEDIRRRYRAAGAPLLNTADCGAIRLYLRPGEGMKANSARRSMRRAWHWPPGEDCP